MPRIVNYLPDINRFHLAGPPQYFLDQLAVFDDSLAIMPSRVGFYYRLGQRRKLQLRENIVNDVLKEDADTKMLASHGLVPVTTIMATANWSNPLLFEELRRRAPWRMGGADEFNKLLDGQEREEKLSKRIEQDEQLEYLSKDAWKYYQKQRGLRSNVYAPVIKGSTNRPPVSTGIRRVAPTKRYRPDLVTNWGNPRLFGQ